MKFKIFAAFTAACVMMAGIASAQTVVGRDMFLSYTNNSTIVDMDAYIGEHNGTLEIERSIAMGRWSSGEADMSKIVEDTNINLKRLVLDTAGDIVTNSLTGAETLSGAISSGGETYIQSRMLFVPSDEIEPSFLDYSGAVGSVTLDNGDLKFGLYAYEYDVTKTVIEGDTPKEVVDVVTNLVIYHSYYATPTTIGGDLVYPVVYTNYVVATPSFDFTQPHTVLVTLKKAKNRDIYFKVRIDSTDISTPLGCKLETIDQAVIPIADEGPWFRAVCNAAAMSNCGISAINFSGTGEIHNLQSSYTSSSTEPAEPDLTYPDDSEITDTALLAWLKDKGATQAQIDNLASVAALNEKYLLNLDLENSIYSLKIKSLTVVGDDVKVEVDLVRSNATAEVSAAIKGELQLWGTADLGTDFVDCDLSEISNDDFSEGTTAEKSFDAKGFKFFKAVIVAPTAAE